MKRKITISIVLALGMVLLSLTSSDSTVNAQQGRRRLVGRTGIYALGPNQVLRMTIAWGDGVAAGDVNGDTLTVRFRRTAYIEQDNVYKPVLETDLIMTLKRGEGATVVINPSGFDAVSGEVVVRGFIGTDITGTVSVINTDTGATVNSVLIALLVP